MCPRQVVFGHFVLSWYGDKPLRVRAIPTLSKRFSLLFKFILVMVLVMDLDLVMGYRYDLPADPRGPFVLPLYDKS